jgi:hypothetical protein
MLCTSFIGPCYIFLIAFFLNLKQNFEKLDYETVSYGYDGVSCGYGNVLLGYVNAPGGYSIQLALYSRNFRSMMAYTFCFNAGTSCDVNPATGISARKTDLDRPGLSEKMLL